MSNIMRHAMESLGFGIQKRAIQIQFSNPALNSTLLLQQIQGEHAINVGLSADLICFSTDASIALKQFIGCQVVVDALTDRGAWVRCSGIITAAAMGQSDAALTVYQLKLQDPTYLWTQRRNSRVFMNKSVPDVIELVFREWQQHSDLFAASLSLDLSGLNSRYDTRPFIMQANESDAAFLTRLLRQEGINWLIDEAQYLVADSTQPIQAQKLRLIDDVHQFTALPRRQIRFHRSSATEQQDSITSLRAQRTLQPTAVHVQRWQADHLAYDEGAGSVITAHQHSVNFNNADVGLENAWHLSPAWMQDLNGEDEATASGHHQLERINQNLSDAYASQAKRFVANSTVRDAQVGYWFQLQGHAEIDSHEQADQEFLICSKSFYQQNNLPKALNDQVLQLLEHSHWQQTWIPNPSAERQANTLILQRRHIALLPDYNPLLHRAAAYPQRAKVVGPSDEDIHVDAWGRIKVRFLFTRPEDHAHDAGAGSNDNDTDSAWVDVLTPWAGESYGGRFLPRINEIVVIDFFDGNIDRPFVLGRIHEAHRVPTQFDAKGQLPETKKLSGIRSQEVAGSGFGQLRFDDTTDQISSQLQSSHAATQLNLGNLSHPKDSEQSEGRGEGFELRSDQSGAIRAGEGLLLSTHAQDQATGMHLEHAVVRQQLDTQLNHAKALSDIALKQLTDPLDVLDQLQSLITSLGEDEPEKAAEFKSAIMLLAAPHSIALSSQQDIHFSAAAQISLSTRHSINLSTQKNWISHASEKISFFAAQGGARLYAGKGNIEIQAQDNALEFIARQGIQITSTEDMVYLTSPKEINFKAGGSELKLNASGVFGTTNMKFEAKAGQHVFLGGERVDPVLPLLPIVPLTPEKPIPTLRSTYAHDQLVYVAKNFSDESFISLVVPIFGLDIPDNVYLQLKQELEQGAIPAPEHIVVANSINGHAAGFNHIDKKIYIAADTVNSATANEENLERLYIVLLHEYGHYIDDLLRKSGKYSLDAGYDLYVISKGDTLSVIAETHSTTIQELCSLNALSDPDVIYIGDILKIPSTTTTLKPDAEHDEGAIYAYNLGQLTEGQDVGAKTEFEFATVKTESYTGPLKITPVSGKKAAKLHADFVAQMNDIVDVEYEYFGAGEGEFANEIKMKANRGKLDSKTGRYIKKDDNKGERVSHGHQSIEQEAIGELHPIKPIFNKHTVDGIYAGNWLRDHSQLVCGAVLNLNIDVAIDAKGKIITIKPTRKLITNILAILAYDHFFDKSVANELVKLKSAEVQDVHAKKLRAVMQKILGKASFDKLSEKDQRRYKALALKTYLPESTLPHRIFSDLTGKNGTNIVGVYRFEEHIDNPFGADVYTKTDRQLNPKVTDKSFKTNTDQKSAQYNFKNYIADNTPENTTDSPFPTALEYMLGQLKKSMQHYSNSDEQLRYLGNAFHVLEDFFAHSNFVEIALIKNGHKDVRHWVLRENEIARYEQIPLVTGTFDAWDTFASVGTQLAELIDPIKKWTEYEEVASGERSLTDLVIQSFIETIDSTTKEQRLTKVWYRYLELRDEISSVVEISYVDLVIKATKTMNDFRTQGALLVTLIRPLLKFLAKWGATIILKHSADIVKLKQQLNPVIHGDNPSHTQLGKDEHNKHLHILASRLAIIAVRDVGTNWRGWLENKNAANQQAVIDAAEKYFRHPSRCDWMDEEVKNWARQNNDQLDKASDGIIQRTWDASKRVAYNKSKKNGGNNE